MESQLTSTYNKKAHLLKGRVLKQIGASLVLSLYIRVARTSLTSKNEAWVVRLTISNFTHHQHQTTSEGPRQKQDLSVIMPQKTKHKNCMKYKKSQIYPMLIHTLNNDTAASLVIIAAASIIFSLIRLDLLRIPIIEWYDSKTAHNPEQSITSLRLLQST